MPLWIYNDNWIMEPFSFHLIPWNTHGEAQHDSINNPLHLFNGSFQNFLLSHILQFINVTLPFAMFAASSGTHGSVRPRTIRARDVVLVHLRSLFFSPTPSLPRPTPQNLSEHRMWDKNISDSFSSCCQCRKGPESCSSTTRSSDPAQQCHRAWLINTYCC